MPTLHVTNGGSAAGILREFLDAPVATAADVLHAGPAPRVGLDEWHRIRGAFLSNGDPADAERIRGELAETDRAIARAARSGEVVLWFEHDLFDQLALIRLLDLLSRAGMVRTALARRGGSDGDGGSKGPALRVSMICIDRFPGVDRFVGLGQLSAPQLATLTGTRAAVTPRQFDLASRAWAAFRADDPASLADLVATDPMDALPFLRPALKRFLEEYPSTDHGLSRTETAMLRALGDGPLDGGDLFAATQAHEEAPFMGDWPFFDLVRDLAGARVPLVTIDPPAAGVDLRGHSVAITDAGRAVLAGRHNALALNGIDRWLGGVHLVGADGSPHGWDRGRETLVSSW